MDPVPLPIQAAGPARLLTLTAPPLPGIAGWRPGQVLAAVVRAAVAPGVFELEIEGSRLQAASRLPLEPGQTLRLSVRQTGARPVLQLVEGLAPEAVLRQGLRRALPRQQSLAPALATLAALAGRGNEALPSAAERLGRALLARLPDPQQLTAPGAFRRALEDSGVFLENRLAAAPPGRPPPVAGDLKAQLLQLVQAAGPAGRAPLPAPDAPPPLPGSPPRPQAAVPPPPDPPPPPELAARLEGAVARIQLHQLASAARGDSSPWPVVSLELPLRHGDGVQVVDLRIRGEGGGGGEPPAAWSVWLALAPAGLGPLRAHVSLHGDRVAVTFWAEDGGAARRLKGALGALRRRLAAAGLQAGRLDSAAGRPESPRPEPPPLVDWRA